MVTVAVDRTRAQCKNCSSQLNFVKSDVRVNLRDYYGKVEAVYWITCPCCKQTVEVKI